MKKIFASIICFLTLSLMHGTNAASFDCERAKSATEVAICTQRSINDADVKMVTTYNIVRKLVSMGQRGVIQDQQVKWLQLRDQCQGDTKCLTEVYKMRQQKLDLVMNKIYEQGPF